MNGSLTVAEVHDRAQKKIVIHAKNRLMDFFRQILNSDEFFKAVNCGEAFCVEKTDLQELWQQLDEQFGKNAERVKKKILSITMEMVKNEGYLLRPENQSDEVNFFSVGFDTPARYVLERIDEKNWLENFLDESNDEESSAPTDNL